MWLVGVSIGASGSDVSRLEVQRRPIMVKHVYLTIARDSSWVNISLVSWRWRGSSRPLETGHKFTRRGYIVTEPVSYVSTI
jgi:hypothetical protein